MVDCDKCPSKKTCNNFIKPIECRMILDCYNCPACWECKEAKIKYIARHYGIESQSLVLIEELSGLTKAITKYNRMKQESLSMKIDEATARDNVVEEMADVLIMIKQVQLLLGIDDLEIEIARNIKIARTMKLIGE